MAAQIAMLVSFAAGSIGGCECGRDVDVDAETQIDAPLAKVEHPEVPLPTVLFAEDWHSDRESLNAFIEQALSSCAQGDYEAFRAMFGSRYVPADRAVFLRAWQEVNRIEVGGLFRRPEDQDVYHLLVLVSRREMDGHVPERREVVLRLIFDEGQWRFRPASEKMIDMVRAASKSPPDEIVQTQPAATNELR